MNHTPPAEPWGAIGLCVLGLALFYTAFRTDTDGPPGPIRRALTMLLILLSGVSVAAAVVVAVLS